MQNTHTQGMAWHGMVWYGMVWYGMAWYGMVWYGMVWYDMVWYGMVWYGMVWYGAVQCNGRYGKAGDSTRKQPGKLNWSRCNAGSLNGSVNKLDQMHECCRMNGEG